VDANIGSVIVLNLRQK